ncbi:hypothetical protein J6590_034796 [Homalodisca vitripennis]|nr:hypothetical protein J6590_034796 [Homalodisca vitripennis]
MKERENVAINFGWEDKVNRLPGTKFPDKWREEGQRSVMTAGVANDKGRGNAVSKVWKHAFQSTRVGQSCNNQRRREEVGTKARSRRNVRTGRRRKSVNVNDENNAAYVYMQCSRAEKSMEHHQKPRQLSVTSSRATKINYKLSTSASPHKCWSSSNNLCPSVPLALALFRAVPT